MAIYTVAMGKVGAHAKVLSAGVVDTVTFALGADQGVAGWANVPRRIEIITDGLSDIYVTVDGSAPTVAGDGTYRVPALAGSTFIDVEDSNSQDPVVVKLISSGAPTYSVSRA